MKASKSAATLWANANRRTNAQNGMGDPGDAITKVITIPALIRSIGTDPAAIELLAARAHELTDAQRMAALKAACPPTKAPKAKARKPKVIPPTLRGMAGVSLWGKHGAPS